MANIENDDYIRVAVRVRPNHYENESELIVRVTGDRNLYLDRKEFTFDKVFNSETTQDEIFNFARPIIDGFIEGYNGTIFAYGQTGSGKTYTMFGKDDGVSLSSDFHESENRGLIPRAVEYLFNQIKFNEQEKQMFNWTIKCSFVELYREKFNDLLDSHSTNLKLKMMGQDRYNVEGATEKEVQFPSDIFQAIMDGWNVRNVAETKMNQRSSRSHAIFMLELDTMEMMPDGITKKRNSRLNLVDLAGSERQRDTGAEGERFNEAIDINQSLSVLARVIRSISTTQSFISFRDSQLTQLLKDSLGGNARTMTIVNVHPNKRYFDNTNSSLDFANNLKKVKNNAKINEALSADKIETWTKKIQAQELEIKRLNERLAQKEEEKSAEKIAYYEEKIEKLEKHVAAFKEFANQKDTDLMVCKAKLKLKDSSVQLLSERLKKTGDDEQVPYLIKECENAILQINTQSRAQVVFGNDLSLELQIQKLKAENDELSDQLKSFEERMTVMKDSHQEEKKLLENQIQRLQDEMTHKRHDMTRQLEESMFGTPSFRRQSIAIVSGVPRTPEDPKDEISQKERKERRKTHFDSSTSRKSMLMSANINLFNSPIQEVNETLRTDEDGTTIPEHDITQRSMENFYQNVELEEKVENLEFERNELEMKLFQSQQVILEFESKEKAQTTELCRQLSIMEQIKGEIAAKSLLLDDMEKQLNQAKEIAAKQESGIRKRDEEILKYSRACTNLQEDVRNLNENLQKYEERCSELQQEVDSLNFRFAEEKKRLEQENQELNKSQEMNKKSLEKVMAEKRLREKELDELKQRLYEKEKENEKLANFGNNKEKISYVNKLRQEKDDLQQENNKLKEKVTMLESNHHPDTPASASQVRHSERIARSKENKPPKK
uniref:Kinesin-like protein n=1 Tax=Acrobeloides nanus TaxID=290746 RepID=A0A914EA56_9BILA